VAFTVLSICLFPIRSFAQTQSASLPPLPFREFRGAWIASVSNIDWPSRPGLSAAQQKAELVALLDKASQLRLNAVILQVRPACDALYASRLEPWSEYLAGRMGQPPEPFYDPLAFAVEQAHQRGLELHAWFNPFRAKHSSAKSPAASNHVTRTHPNWIRSCGKMLWLDPGEKAAQEYVMSVILDVVRRYDIDGVHLDDYFYPYKEKGSNGKLIDFPDDATWNPYKTAGGKLSRNDWRRQNVNDFVHQLYQRIKSEKRWVKFGLSPFGIWRPGHPPPIKGMDAYEDIYADSRKWLASGWCDYFAPQLYWPIHPPEHSYSTLLRWWAAQNERKRHVWPGSKSAAVGHGWRKEEILEQIRQARKEPGVTGHLHWHINTLMTNAGGLSGALAKELYAQPALIPASPWLDDKPPTEATILFDRNANRGELKASWSVAGAEPAWLWVLQFKSNGAWATEVLPGRQASRIWTRIDSRVLPEVVAVAAVDRTGNMAQWTVVETKQTTRLRSSNPKIRTGGNGGNRGG
jgi:uncharacterized lipoprotein YddW (UPF0748 family)